MGMLDEGQWTYLVYVGCLLNWMLDTHVLIPN
jgi:hypothetical protein